MNIFGDTTIKAGDMAIVVRDCCGHWLGRPLRVESVSAVPGVYDWLRCDQCDRRWTNIAYVVVEDGFARKFWHVPLWWLKKIDPPALTETEDEREELTA